MGGVNTCHTSSGTPQSDAGNLGVPGQVTQRGQIRAPCRTVCGV